jgi:hypothetical protein
MDTFVERLGDLLVLDDLLMPWAISPAASESIDARNNLDERLHREFQRQWAGRAEPPLDPAAAGPLE